ncbi:MAG: DUF2784 family protein [Bacteroidales bacterium]
MNDFLLHIIDGFFVVFHTGLTLFNVLGWIFRKTRRLNLITVSLTAASWYILGIFYGMGYCFLTDWHYRVLRELGWQDIPNSYFKFLIERFSDFSPPEELVDNVTVTVFFVVMAASVFVNALDIARKKRR